MPQNKLSWGEALQVYLKPRVLAMFFLGFSAGLPLLLVFSTMTAWLRDYGVSRTAIGFFAWVGITFSIKVLWAPVIDYLRLPLLTRWLGKRRSWMLVSQLGVALGLLGMGSLNPQLALTQVAVLAVWVAFCSASQDVVIDAYRIEAVDKELQGAMAANYVFGYRVALLVAGAGALYIAELANWPMSYTVMALLMGVGVITTLLVAEPDHSKVKAQAASFQHAWVDRMLGSGEHGPLKEWFVRAVACPFIEFFERNGRFALVLLLFIGIYRLSDIAMGVMANPFYLDLGFSKSDIAEIGKIFGFFCTIIGSFLGGLLVVRYGIMRPLILGAAMVAATNLLFAHLAQVGPDKVWLAVVISADNISGGISNAVFIAYLSSLTNQAYTATQYALFSSLMTLPGKFISGFSGVVVDAQGYAQFFVYVALLGTPAVILAVYLWWRDSRGSKAASGT
ncbi:AmpG family muropeptide MFS transporter [Microbulbifer thermotolerans]|uniref:AmpG family muropeptide MFS transporter n=1 Tax=Microbulbifer thermotolerans TaxID=252514 RepID=A0A143HMV5_MICTH|nr:AmpG family muropeptide MFS transporter [Microbulbifer thermotolerans]AMX03023.1 AmpG family muropeptide MFS transporter [Microbulbifer thermotolerans]MCX2778980.1 AmpG family muropeptide MFS transporter [Microbulbifer thermotolerans]MCX2795748.1 AmpG family muropeptide MFS transporter [Microbulbifer thermotolerans]MCX2802010.1 AmpG family muropeptide MFS transporter [Microbulbifer thermotolerans]MCX2804722.1 AmpG family muropeptide MFS transporter [Microbulbifer thermotolerans]